jgi:hypothetical protein
VARSEREWQGRTTWTARRIVDNVVRGHDGENVVRDGSAARDADGVVLVWVRDKRR